MAAQRPSVQVMIPTVIGAGTPQVCALPGTVTMGGAAGGGGTNPYFLLQNGNINNNSGNAVHVALVNGSAVAAATAWLMMVPANDMREFWMTTGHDRYEGYKIDAAGGLCIKYVGTSLGTAGTVSVAVKIQDVLQ